MASGTMDSERNAPAEVARTGQGGAKAIATHSRNSRAQDNVEREQMKAGFNPAELPRKKEPNNPAE